MRLLLVLVFVLIVTALAAPRKNKKERMPKSSELDSSSSEEGHETGGGSLDGCFFYNNLTKRTEPCTLQTENPGGKSSTGSIFRSNGQSNVDGVVWLCPHNTYPNARTKRALCKPL